ncbi:hypothetical protein L249_1258 [Ophiocordyceps polyrhachis-furcata BCC 54312]|uniref:histone acetyltransferase n=1 Tax=Ophiocordyceps polyrhachis-furcata BCC 54312 TaxID=1330021 RepID=A0A367LE57_9HYPO|nr:hypothetical protein L249_1258 [Ophiocordyceps polyrhachis-furcata BCC 54312]
MPPKRKLPPTTAEAPPSQPQEPQAPGQRASRKTPLPVSDRFREMRRGWGRGGPSELVAPEITYHVPQQQQQQQQQEGFSALVRPLGPTQQQQQESSKQKKKPSSTALPPPRADRNIDKVVLGNLCFRTWYSSQYGKEVFDNNVYNTNSNNNNSSSNSHHNNSNSNTTQAMTSSSHKREPPRMLERLYVCPCCFKYARELVAWRGHVRLCERRRHVPGHKIYVHPRTRRRREDGKDSGEGFKRRRAESCVDHLAESEGEWSIWEVDGDKDGLEKGFGGEELVVVGSLTSFELFCQNLSLFAKLFLDNKSVFFDVSGFNYFLLVYTPPTRLLPPPGSNLGPPAPQVTGFFSKEKLSWDSNNLACILIFPPWQRKGLGSLLMGASYEISRREGVIGGPEKPISDLGRRGYRRYWASEIARWLLGVEVGSVGGEGGVVISIGDVSRATWIAQEDCLAVLREMGVVEDGGGGGVEGVPRSNDGRP